MPAPIITTLLGLPALGDATIIEEHTPRPTLESTEDFRNVLRVSMLASEAVGRRAIRLTHEWSTRASRARVSSSWPRVGIVAPNRFERLVGYSSINRIVEEQPVIRPESMPSAEVTTHKPTG